LGPTRIGTIASVAGRTYHEKPRSTCSHVSWHFPPKGEKYQQSPLPDVPPLGHSSQQISLQVYVSTALPYQTPSNPSSSYVPGGCIVQLPATNVSSGMTSFGTHPDAHCPNVEQFTIISQHVSTSSAAHSLPTHLIASASGLSHL
jgi:hypothetical protein